MITLKNLYDSIGQAPRNEDKVTWIEVDEETRAEHDREVTLYGVSVSEDTHFYKSSPDHNFYYKISSWTFDAFDKNITITRNGRQLYPFESKGDALMSLTQTLDYSGAKYAYLVGRAIDKLIDEKIAKSKGEAK